ncbi:pyridoxal phosphate-dependent decarboxylase family protein [Microbacterium hydrocarbonoxydans]|uniref:pyridoxal phosphate-dependent decarboxylase family protein n=1 Tax=Microbacterium hydrocarbonoxydans TaxID=273678 RepID=UPI0007BC13D4|nr:aminotransferase class V-fold PLP-dependent enzyme [Microbacterium hydrocarbonoxydans]GAT73679.1 L-2,4-diaminobutyrate decarboxylase [Microbacterium sp. HM58-2]
MDAVRMHAASPESTSIVDSVLEYSRRRMLAKDVPLDKPQTPAELNRLVGPTITDAGLGAARALSVFEHILAPACLTTSHPQYLSFIPAAPTMAAVAFDLVVSASGLYGGSWLEGSGAVHAENEVLSFLAAEFGLPETAGGVFVQGGTIGNLSALVAARETAKSQLLAAGRELPDRWKIVCSKEAHSSNKSAAKVMDADVVLVPAGEDGVLRADAVREALIEHGDAVCAVVATGGSTNFGIVDDIAGIAALKDEFDFWLHIDGAYGLTAMLAPATRPLFDGVGRADSVIVDPHKWLYAPFDCCALIYRDPENGRRAHTQHAEYLDTLTDGDDFSPSDYSIQLTRRPRGLPLWFSLATYGIDAYRDSIGATVALTKRIAEEISRRPELTLVRDPQLSVVVFERNGWDRADYDRWSDELLDSQRAFVVPSSHAGRPNTRFAILNPLTTFEDLVGILDTMK